MHRITLLFLILISNILLAQNEIGNKLVKDKFLKYFELPRESVFLHTNKTMYIVNEEVWLKGYVYDRHNGKPFSETTTVHVGLYNVDGKKFDDYHFKASNGYFKGNIAVDSMLASGEYYLRSSTNWMKNFIEDDSFVQKITILNEKLIEKAKSVREYDIQFLPEGGNLIEDAPGVMGVKVTDANGYGVKIVEGSVFDTNDTQVARFYTSIFGLGKFNFNPKAGIEYVAKIKFDDGSTKTTKIQKPSKVGISFTVKSVNNDQFVISLTTNVATKEIINEKQFYLLVHKDGQANKIPITFPKNKLYVSKVLNKEVLNKGMNILTLFNPDGRPIAERLIFNYADFLDAELEISKLSTASDSLNIQVKLLDTAKALQNLSVSVLPGNTISYNQKNSIYSTFYLKPYVKGFIENPKYYFKDVTPKKEKDLDLLLMTQGWSRYDWTNIFKGAPNRFFEFENGIDLEGSIYNKGVTSNDKLLVSFPDNRSRYLDILDNRFLIQRNFPVKGETLEFTLIRENRKLAKVNIDLNIRLGGIPNEIETTWKEKADFINDNDSEDVIVPSITYADNTINLNEVTVIEEKLKTTVEKNTLIPKYLSRKMTEVTENLEFSLPYVTDIIRSRGYNVLEGLQFGSTSRVIIRSIIPSSFLGGNTYPIPIIYLDNARLPNFDILYKMPTTEIESFMIDKTGSFEGARGAGGVIRIYTRRLPRDYNDHYSRDENVFKYELKEGFEPVKKFYTPKYTSYLSNEFENFGTIHWVPELQTDENGIATFKILNTFQSNVSFFIEGMGSEGQLISAEQTLVVE